MAAYVSIRQHTSAYVSIRQHTSAYVSIRQNTSAYVSIRQHTAEYETCCTRSSPAADGSIRQHTSAYVSIRQHGGAAASAYKKLMHEPRISVFTVSHTSAYVSICTNLVLVYSQFCIRQHTSAYVSIRQQLRHMKLMHEPRISVFAVSHHYNHTLMSLHAKSINTAFKVNPQYYHCLPSKPSEVLLR